jgi:hypothetical protein
VAGGSIKEEEDLQDANKKLFSLSFLLLLFEDTNIIFQREKVIKKSQNSRNQGFSYYFCLMIERSGPVPLTNGSRSGFRRPKNIRIRIRNTAHFFHLDPVCIHK